MQRASNSSVTPHPLFQALRKPFRGLFLLLKVRFNHPRPNFVICNIYNTWRYDALAMYFNKGTQEQANVHPVRPNLYFPQKYSPAQLHQNTMILFTRGAAHQFQISYWESRRPLDSRAGCGIVDSDGNDKVRSIGVLQLNVKP